MLPGCVWPTRSYTARMPELPEVEHLRRTLEASLIGRRVERIRAWRLTLPNALVLTMVAKP